MYGERGGGMICEMLVTAGKKDRSEAKTSVERAPSRKREQEPNWKGHFVLHDRLCVCVCASMCLYDCMWIECGTKNVRKNETEPNHIVHWKGRGENERSKGPELAAKGNRKEV